jgi:hypothetical protein
VKTNGNLIKTMKYIFYIYFFIYFPCTMSKSKFLKLAWNFLHAMKIHEDMWWSWLFASC